VRNQQAGAALGACRHLIPIAGASFHKFFFLAQSEHTIREVVTDMIGYLKIKTELGKTILDLALPRP
jgi:hypothetical protein